MKSFLIGFSVSLVAFVLSLEIRKDLGNVWYRMDSNNKKSINLQSLATFFSKPFHTKFFWSPKFIDLNWIVVSSLGGIINIYLSNINFFSNTKI